MNIEKFISPLIANQFPEFYKEDGQNFIEFVKTYYEWMEETGNIINASRSLLEYSDIDYTLDQFLVYFKNKYINSLPENIALDKRLLIKHITDLYNSKGSERGYRLLFRMIFNEEIDIFIPGEYMFKPSDAQWTIPKYIEVTESLYLQDLVGKRIKSTNGANAIVDGFFEKIIKGKVIYLLYLSSVHGTFKYNDKILCDSIPEMTIEHAPIVFGSLTSISITSGGINYNVGDILSVEGDGVGGKVAVSSVIDQSGKVDFQLVNGGYGFTVNAQVTVSGGSGSGATFQVGGITNKQIYTINTDEINPLLFANLEYDAQKLKLGFSANVGAFNNGNMITSSANAKHLDVTFLSGTLQVGETLSNTELGLSNLYIYKADETLIYITGTEAMLTSSNLSANAVLVGNSTGAFVKVNSVYPKLIITGLAYVNTSASNSTSLSVYNTTANIGYFVAGSTITSNTGSTANVTSVSRVDQDWRLSNNFPIFPISQNNTNLDSIIGEVLSIQNLEIGTITYLKNINPGVGYTTNPTVVVREPYIYQLGIPDDTGGVWGGDAEVNALAGRKSGIVTGVQMVDSGYGYIQNQGTILTSNTNSSGVFGTTIVESTGINIGSWKNNKSFLSDEQYIEDSSYYQVFSYEIMTKRMIDTYRRLVTDLVHPTGIALYGRYTIRNTIVDQTSEPISFSISQQ